MKTPTEILADSLTNFITETQNEINLLKETVKTQDHYIKVLMRNVANLDKIVDSFVDFEENFHYLERQVTELENLIEK